jgi:hypothetical protein
MTAFGSSIILPDSGLEISASSDIESINADGLQPIERLRVASAAQSRTVI